VGDLSADFDGRTVSGRMAVEVLVLLLLRGHDGSGAQQRHLGELHCEEVDS